MTPQALQRALVLLGVVLALSFVGGSCSGDPPGAGYLVIEAATPDLVGTPLAKLGSVTAHAQRLDVVHRSNCSDPNTEKVITVDSTPGTIVLNAGRPNVPALLSPQVAVPQGCITQIRMITDSIEVSLDGKTETAKAPSGPQTGLKVVPINESKPFTVDKDKTTVVLVHYDPNESLIFNKGQGVIEKPVLRGEQVEAEFGIGVILDEVVLTFDDTATQNDIQTLIGSAGDQIQTQWPRKYVTVKLPNTALLHDRIAFYTGKPHVNSVLPNSFVELQGPNPFPMGTPNDPLYQDAPPTGIETVNLDAVHALNAWRVTTGSTGPPPTDIVTGIVDNGYDLLHQDLLDNIWINEGEIPAAIKLLIKDIDGDNHTTFRDLNDPANANAAICNKAASPPTGLCDPLDLVDGKGTNGYGWQDNKDDDKNDLIDDIFGYEFQDGSPKDNLPEPYPPCSDPKACKPGESSVPNHGTGVAGIMAGIGNNGVAGVGVAWRTRIILAKGQIFNTGQATGAINDRMKRDSFVRAARYVHQMGARVVNTSLGTAMFREDALVPGDCRRGLQGIRKDKFKPGIEGLSREWNEMLDRSKTVLTVALNDCAENDDSDGTFFYPGGFVRARPDIGVASADVTMISVTSADAWDSFNNKPKTFPSLNGYASFGNQTALIAAPGSFWRMNDIQAYPPVGLNTKTTDCGGKQRCSGTSLAAPVVAGAAILTAVNNTQLSAIGIKSRILDNATDAVSLLNVVQGNPGGKGIAVSRILGPGPSKLRQACT